MKDESEDVATSAPNKDGNTNLTASHLTIGISDQNVLQNSIQKPDPESDPYFFGLLDPGTEIICTDPDP